jgi:signal transduction histidine kinase
MQFELTQAASHSIALLVLGYMISHWGGNELALRRRMDLLSELASPLAPPVTLEMLISGQLARLLDFFGAQAALVVLPGANGACRLYRSDVARSTPALRADELREELARPLLGLPPALRMCFDADRARRACSLLPGGDADHDREAIEAHCLGLANLLETRRFASVPYQPAAGMTGRLYVISPAQGFTRAETEFLGHAATQLAAAANNAMLMQELTATAARQERSKISRDIHDTTVQSYIGLKLGLEALYRDIGKDGGAAPRIKELLDIATSTVDDLRHYVDRLRERGGPRNAQLMARIDEQRRRYVTLHGIRVDVRADSQLAIGEAASVEAYQFVCEALSNIARHTSAKRASIDLRREGDSLAIEVGNDCAQPAATKPFIPRSITERAASLGGNVQVRLNNAGRDVVRVTIPLSAQAPAGVGLHGH